MINEIYEVERYLNGENIDKKNLHRSCYLIAKYYKEKGLNKLEIRQAIFEWGKQHNIYFTFSINDVIYQVLNDDNKLRGDIHVYISQSDIDEIDCRFDNKKCKHVALAILCLAKVTANSEKEIVVSGASLASWIGIHATNLSSRYLPELIDFDYIELVGNDEMYFTWNNSKPMSKNRRYRIKVPIINSPNEAVAELRNNDIKELCSELF